MKNILEMEFLNAVNQNIAIIHKVCNIYFKNPADRQDVFQEILYQLWKSYKSFTGASKFSTWMYRVAFNTAIGHVKSINKEAPKEEINEYHLQTVENNDTQERNENITLLYKAVHTLSDIDKAITLLYLEDKSYEEMAAITGLTKTNISVRLVRIRKQLKEKMNVLIN